LLKILKYELDKSYFLISLPPFPNVFKSLINTRFLTQILLLTGSRIEFDAEALAGNICCSRSSNASNLVFTDGNVLQASSYLTKRWVGFRCYTWWPISTSSATIR
jgi:hypothetical protein